MEHDGMRQRETPAATVTPGSEDLQASGVRAPVQIAIFGLGRAGQIHIQNLAANRRVAVRYMVDLSIDTLRRTQEEFRLHETQLVLAGDADRVFNDPELRAVVVCSTTNTHEGLIRRALGAGIAVFCEKPIAEKIDDIIACYRLAKEKKAPLHCSFNRRFDPSLADVRSRMRDEVGTVNVVKTTSRDSPLPPMEYLRCSGGIFHDCAVHDLDLACWLLEEWPTTVFVMASARDERIKAFDDVDVANIMLRFPSGALAHLDLSRHSTVGYDQRLEVAGMRGMLQMENSPANKVATYNDEGAHRPRFDHSFPQRYRESYQRSMRHFLDQVEDGVAPEVGALSSINVTKLASVCEESWREGRPLTFEPLTTL